jgi:hypothetical protein
MAENHHEVVLQLEKVELELLFRRARCEHPRQVSTNESVWCRDCGAFSEGGEWRVPLIVELACALALDVEAARGGR